MLTNEPLHVFEAPSNVFLAMKNQGEPREVVEGETQNIPTFSISFKELVELIKNRFYWAQALHSTLCSGWCEGGLGN